MLSKNNPPAPLSVVREDHKQYEVLALLRKVRDDGEWKEVPNMRAVDRKKLMKEVELVEGVMHNLLSQGMGVTQVNRLLYAGGAVVALRLGLKLGAGKKGKAKKPMWQRRIEASIVTWRGHLSQVEEIRKGSAVGEKVRKELERKYQLTERGAVCVSTFLKNKIQAGSTKIRWFEEKNGATFFEITRDSCLRNSEVIPQVTLTRLLMQQSLRRFGRRFGLSRRSMTRRRAG